jgi:hypothetical protein
VRRIDVRRPGNAAGGAETVTNHTRDGAAQASFTNEMAHQFMYPKVTPVKPQPSTAKQGAPPAGRASR